MQEEEKYKTIMNSDNAVTNYMSACKVHEEQPTEESHNAVVEAAQKLLPLYDLVDSLHQVDALSEGKERDKSLAAKILESFREE